MDAKYQARRAERKRKEQERAPKSLLWLGQTDPIAKFTAWLVVFTACLVFVGILQRCSIEGQLDEMKRAGNDTHDLAQSAQLDQRAWLGASDYSFEIVKSKPLKGTVLVLNTGKTPAMGVVTKMNAISKSKESPFSEADILYTDPADHKQGTIFPNQRFPMWTQSTEPIDVSLFEYLDAGVSVEYFFGSVEYRDVFQKDHWTHFCVQYSPSTKSGTPCAIYNDSDDDKRDPRSKAP